ncbi:MAG: hypothetical protein QOI60_143 [Actinomycetota bacterium]|nr:hypothetical protein [Actinomycetota bacterium]MEA2581850.1 hypothetical protein [Actinomycetota bacterium]
MLITSDVAELPAGVVKRALSGLPEAVGYRLQVKSLRYREKPHLAAVTEFEERLITIQIPEPFLPFGEVIPYGARRRPGGGKMRFIWLTEGCTFRTRREVLRFLYCHEWMHWYLKEELGRKSQAETTCDRFALRNYRRRTVTRAEAQAALKPARE